MAYHETGMDAASAGAGFVFWIVVLMFWGLSILITWFIIKTAVLSALRDAYREQRPRHAPPQQTYQPAPQPEVPPQSPYRFIGPAAAAWQQQAAQPRGQFDIVDDSVE